VAQKLVAVVDRNPRIEDQEIIDEHNRDVERMNQQGRIVEPPSEEVLRISPSEDL
jgi:hypothetical protein